MVSNKPDVCSPFNDRVVGGEVANPEETLATELDGIGHEVEHCHPDRELDEHRQTSAERADTVFRIECHHSLLLLHLVLRLVVLFCGFLNFWLEHAHLGRTHVALFHQRIGDDLEEQRY